MDFEYTEEQQLLADSVSKYLAKAYDFESRKQTIHSSTGFNAAAWTALSDMGLTAIPFAQADGGFGGGAVDMMAAMEAFGEALVVEPLLDHIALAGRLVAHAGTQTQRAALLPTLVDGSLKASFAFLERGQRYTLEPTTTTATRSGRPSAN